MALSNNDVRSCRRQKREKAQGSAFGRTNAAKRLGPGRKTAYLIVGLSEVVQGQDVIQESGEIGGKVLQHEAVVVGLFEIPHLFLREIEKIVSSAIFRHVPHTISGL